MAPLVQGAFFVIPYRRAVSSASGTVFSLGRPGERTQWDRPGVNPPLHSVNEFRMIW